MKKKLIIVVDDDLVSLKVAYNILEEKYAVVTVPSAKKLFSILENCRPDLILLDVEMPEMNGYEAIEILKEKPETRDIPVIFLTGKINHGYEQRGYSMGAVDFITKPTLPPLLLERLETHLPTEKN